MANETIVKQLNDFEERIMTSLLCENKECFKLRLWWMKTKNPPEAQDVHCDFADADLGEFGDLYIGILPLAISGSYVQLFPKISKGKSVNGVMVKIPCGKMLIFPGNVPHNGGYSDNNASFHERVGFHFTLNSDRTPLPSKNITQKWYHDRDNVNEQVVYNDHVTHSVKSLAMDVGDLAVNCSVGQGVSFSI